MKKAFHMAKFIIKSFLILKHLKTSNTDAEQLQWEKKSDLEKNLILIICTLTKGEINHESIFAD